MGCCLVFLPAFFVRLCFGSNFIWEHVGILHLSLLLRCHFRASTVVAVSEGCTAGCCNLLFGTHRIRMGQRWGLCEQAHAWFHWWWLGWKSQAILLAPRFAGKLLSSWSMLGRWAWCLEVCRVLCFRLAWLGCSHKMAHLLSWHLHIYYHICYRICCHTYFHICCRTYTNTYSSICCHIYFSICFSICYLFLHLSWGLFWDLILNLFWWPLSWLQELDTLRAYSPFDPSYCHSSPHPVAAILFIVSNLSTWGCRFVAVGAVAVVVVVVEDESILWLDWMPGWLEVGCWLKLALRLVLIISYCLGMLG